MNTTARVNKGMVEGNNLALIVIQRDNKKISIYMVFTYTYVCRVIYRVIQKFCNYKFYFIDLTKI